MSRTFVAPRVVVVVLLVALVASAWHGVFAQDPTYVETTGYRDVLAAVSRLETAGGRLNAARRQELIAEGRALIALEESYKPGTTPIQQEIKRAEARSKSLDDEGRGLADRKARLEADPKRTQAQVDAYNAASNNFNGRLSAHNTYYRDLESRIQADTRRLESSYAAFAQRVSAAFSAASGQLVPANASNPRSAVPIDKIVVPSPEIIATKYIQLDPKKWSDDLKPLVSASNKILREAQEDATETVDNARKKLKEVAVDRVLENIPGYGTFRSLRDDYSELQKGIAEPILNLCRSALANFESGVLAASDPNNGGRFAGESDQIQGERLQNSFLTRARNKTEGKLRGAAVETLGGWDLVRPAAEAVEPPPVVAIEGPVPPLDGRRWR